MGVDPRRLRGPTPLSGSDQPDSVLEAAFALYPLSRPAPGEGLDLLQPRHRRESFLSTPRLSQKQEAISCPYSPLPNCSEWEVAFLCPLLPLFGGLRFEDPLQFLAVALHLELLQQPLPEVRLEGGQRHVPLPRPVQPVAGKAVTEDAAARREPLAQWLGKGPRCLREGHLLIPCALSSLPGEQQREGGAHRLLGPRQVGYQNGRHLGRRQRPKARLVGQIVARRIIFRRGMSDDRDLAQLWKTGVKLGPRESEPSQRRGPTRRQQQIRRLQPVVQRSAVLLVLQVETRDFLSGAQVLVVAGAHPGQRVPARRLDLDRGRPHSAKPR